MLYTLIGFGLAALFGIGVHTALGYDALLAPWVDPVFWGIMLTGVILDHQARFRAWFATAPLLAQNLVVAAGFLALAAGLTLLLRDSPWTWHIAG
jgi:hypothetical protein